MAMVVFNEDRTVESRQLLDRFVNTETFRIVREVGSAAEMASEFVPGTLTSDWKSRLISPASFAPEGPLRRNC